MKKLAVLAVIACVSVGNSVPVMAFWSKKIACDDSKVKSTVLSILRESLQNQLFKVYIYNAIGSLPNQWAGLSYKEFKAQVSTDLERAALKKTDETVESIRLTAIRLQGVNEQTGAVSCAANFVDRAGDGGSVTYTAQPTTDGEIYVEVQGL